MNAYLYPAQNSQPKFQLTDYFIVGSDANCNWVQAKASPRHAKIEASPYGYILKDLRSETGTFLNDQKIQEAPLAEGDWIQIGEAELMFSLKSQKEPTAFSLTSKNADWNEKLQQMATVARTNYAVLILGASGTGKDVIAQEIHKSSTRSAGPFVCVNCSALSESLIESELFGHVRGSFTGALNDRKGAFEAARGGTLFLDEIGDLSPNLQAKLLRALENNEIRAVGSDITIKTDVRILAATHNNLLHKIATGDFRSDLYYRLNVVSIQAPGLFEHMEDFDGLLMHFAKQMKVRFDFSAILRLRKHSWPGNIRELKNTVARASAIFGRQTVDEQKVEQILDRVTLGANDQPISDGGGSPLPFLKEMERQLIVKRLSANRGNQRKTASDLGIPKSTLHDRLRGYNIDPKSFVES